MAEETKYPIYNIGARWLESREVGKDYCKWQIEDAPDDKMWNSTDYYKAFKENPNNTVLRKAACEWWNRYETKRTGNGIVMSSPIIIIQFIENETWWLTWFQHETFDIGQTNEEALQSFGRFVDRKKEQGRKDKGDTGYYLMGADDRYRWTGSEPDGDSHSRSDPPCRCKHCKKQGLIRIGH